IVLAIIITLNKYVIIDDIRISLAFICVCALSIILFARQAYTFYDICSTFTLVIVVSGLLLWEETATTVFILPTMVLFSFLLALLLALLITSLQGQLVMLVISIAYGSFIYEWIMLSYQLRNTIEHETVFTLVVFTVVFLIFVAMLRVVLAWCMNRLFIRNKFY